MEVSLKQIDLGSRNILENLFSYYVYDMSEFMGWGPNSEGLYAFNSETLDSYWKEASHVPYFIYVDKEIAGFALVRNYSIEPEIFDIEQYFVLRKFKGKGVGKKALLAVVANHPGKWQIRVLKENEAALKFWDSAVKNIVGSRYDVSLDIDVDLEMYFIRFEAVS
ncbi:GNAT family N-acetyltransferase [Photobacterium sp. CAU 1568]|uniref:GNAT family N-acetyltransferase n=1 Tax=Photobacterium arenosum TaxID=2774143 RepID=A0ABR9BJZ0_9GAMM|nr:GNAT family N-acetyltransferase [Photobacterium arenosum]MBD8512874.1 GNAT family N-acetyltransferase [Photobacterium arenosum]